MFQISIPIYYLFGKIGRQGRIGREAVDVRPFQNCQQFDSGTLEWWVLGWPGTLIYMHGCNASGWDIPPNTSLIGTTLYSQKAWLKPPNMSSISTTHLCQLLCPILRVIFKCFQEDALPWVILVTWTQQLVCYLLIAHVWEHFPVKTCICSLYCSFHVWLKPLDPQLLVTIFMDLHQWLDITKRHKECIGLTRCSYLDLLDLRICSPNKQNSAHVSKEPTWHGQSPQSAHCLRLVTSRANFGINSRVC